MPITTKILYSANTFCLLLFLGMAFVLPLHGQAQAQTRLDELRRSPTLTTTMHPNGGPNSAAIWIVDPALTGVRAAANVGIALTLLNVSLFAASQLKKKKKA